MLFFESKLKLIIPTMFSIDQKFLTNKSNCSYIKRLHLYYQFWLCTLQTVHINDKIVASDDAINIDINLIEKLFIYDQRVFIYTFPILKEKKPKKIQYFQVMKALCYVTKLMSGLYATSNTEKSKKLAIFSSKISGARATLRYISD